MGNISLVDWATIVEAIVVVISLIFILLQMKQNSKLAKAANALALVEQAGSFNSLLIQDTKIAKLWYSRGKGLKKLETLRYRELLVQWLIFHENIYHQNEQKLLDAQIYNSWREDLKFFVQTQNIDIVSTDFQKFFPSGFGKHILELQKEDFNASFEPKFELDDDD